MTGRQRRLPFRRRAATGKGQAAGSSGDGAMSLIEHLRELRNRIGLALIGILIGMVVAFIFYDEILTFLKAPYCNLTTEVRGELSERNNGDCTLLLFDVLSNLTLRLKIALIAGLVVSAPWWLYQLWAFITPGLKQNERRYALIFVAASTVLFAAGCAMAYITLTNGLKLLLSLSGDGIESVLGATEYLGFVMQLLLAFGIAFEVPLLGVMLNSVGILSYAVLSKSRRWLFFLTFVLAAFITPTTDPFTMLALAIPMAILFEGAIQFARINDKRRARRDAAEGWGHLDDDEASPLDASPSELPAEAEPAEDQRRYDAIT
ncbi:MAG: twin-arginine translocase subunit TatC [Actinomycetota bacterium]|nr:twin-arginine translocase subunit TatC [Actinomycetota bacterium]